MQITLWGSGIRSIGLGVQGLGVLSLRVENPTEKTMEHNTETGFRIHLQGLVA